ncbi:hypothetical protein D3C72_1714130 [compost metagenome]
MDTGIDIVEQQADVNAAIRGHQDFAREQETGEIVLPVVVLQVEAAAGPAGRMRPDHEGFDVVGNQRYAVLAGAGSKQRADRPIEGGIGVGDRKCSRRISMGATTEAAIDIEDRCAERAADGDNGNNDKGQHHLPARKCLRPIRPGSLQSVRCYGLPACRPSDRSMP